MESFQGEAKAWAIADFRFEAEVNRLVGADSETTFEPRTAAVLLDLMQHAGEVRSRGELLDAVWGDAFVGEAALTHCIWELRRAFGDSARDSKFIQTVPRRGYRLVAAVTPPESSMLRTLTRLEGAEGPLEAEQVGVLEEDLVSGATPVMAGRDPLWLFDRPLEAVRFALAAHRASGPSGLRAVVHMDEVSSRVPAEGGRAEVSGPAVEWLNGLMPLAASGQTLLTRGAFDLARRSAEREPGTPGLRWLAHGSYAVEGRGESIEIYEVGEEGVAPLEAPADSRQARRSSGDSTIRGWRPAPGLPVPRRRQWRLVRKLGQGGFGEVWLTEHAKTRDRRVFKFCFESERLRALQREVTLFRLLREALGHREDIVRLLDWELDRPPYFIEMEHTAAGNLADWLAEQGGFGEVPIPLRLELVAQTAEALAAAHSVGVLHKDVKPSNILLGAGPEGAPRVRLGDFGISHLVEPRRLEEAGITALGLTEEEASTSAGTRLYMAPEVLEGRAASTEADVYSLGVVLYQMVVGDLDRALATGWRRHVGDELLTEDIADCVDVAPERRPSARELVERLRGLDSRRASRDRALEQQRAAQAALVTLERTAQRRRWWLKAAAVLGVATLIVWLAALDAMRARRAAEESQRRAEQLVGFMLGDLRHSLASVGRLDAMDGTLERVMAHLEAVDPEELGADGLARRAEALRQVGEVRLQQGDLAAAEEVFGDAAAVAGRLLAWDPDRGDWRAGEADSRYWLAYLKDKRGDLDGAAQGYEYHRAAYERLVLEQPDEAAWRLELAAGHHNVAGVAAKRGNLEEALHHYRRSRDEFERLSRLSPEDRDLRLRLAGSHNRVGLVQHRRGELVSALAEYEADHELLTELAAASPDDIRLRERLATSSSYAGSVLFMLGRSQLALARFREVLEIRRGLTQLEPEQAPWRRYLAISHRRLGGALGAMGEWEEAGAHLRAAGELLDGLGAGERELFTVRLERGVLLRLEARRLSQGPGGAARAEEVARQAVESLRQLSASSPGDPRVIPQLALAHLRLGDVLDAAGSPEAAASWRRVVTLLGPQSADSPSPQVLSPLVLAHLRLGEKESARALASRLASQGYRPPGFEDVYGQLGLSL